MTASDLAEVFLARKAETCQRLKGRMDEDSIAYVRSLDQDGFDSLSDVLASYLPCLVSL